MIFRGWQKVSLIEYPGKIVSVLWVEGCNFRCPWCYNKDLVLSPENLPLIEENEILNFLKKRIAFLDGIIITGGEPFAYKNIKNKEEDLINFITKVKKFGFQVGVETNGSFPEKLKKLIKRKFIDFAAMDVKAPLRKQIYDKIAGVNVDLDKIKKSIDIIKNSGIEHEFRTTAIPTLNKSDIIKIVQQLGAEKYVLRQFNQKDTILNEEYKRMKPYSDEELKEMQKEAKKFIKNTILRI